MINSLTLLYYYPYQTRLFLTSKLVAAAAAAPSALLHCVAPNVLSIGPSVCQLHFDVLFKAVGLILTEIWPFKDRLFYFNYFIISNTLLLANLTNIFSFFSYLFHFISQFFSFFQLLSCSYSLLSFSYFFMFTFLSLFIAFLFLFHLTCNM